MRQDKLVMKANGLETLDVQDRINVGVPDATEVARRWGIGYALPSRD
jgi:hypothetical protein